MCSLSLDGALFVTLHSYSHSVVVLLRKQERMNYFFVGRWFWTDVVSFYETTAYRIYSNQAGSDFKPTPEIQKARK